MEAKTTVKWYRCPVDRETMSRLKVRSDWRGLRQMGLHLLLLIALGTAAVAGVHYHWHWAIILAAIYLYGTFFAFIGLGGAGHELCHKTVFKSNFLNEFFLKLSAFLTYYNYPMFIASHVKHHQFTVHNDLDMEVILPQKLSRGVWFYAFVCNPVAVFNAYRGHIRLAAGRFQGPWENRLIDSDKKLRRKVMNWSRFLLFGHLALAAVFIYFHLWIMLVLITFGTFYAGWLNMLCGFPQHAGMTSNVPDFRLSCRTMILSPFVSFLYWQMNYHMEHHMFPGVPCYNLQELRKEIEEDLPPAPRGLWATWKEVFSILRKQKQDPSYSYSPPLPTATGHQLVASSPQEVMADM